MAHASDLIAEDIEAYLAQQERKELLRFLTCGSVDDGKSTLIGRLLHDSKMLYEDQLEAVRRDSSKVGTQGDNIDLALVVDGLQAEREQGITIDVAYRFFSTKRRKFVIADTPGHEQYTRNMVTGASNCDVAVILIDARQGVLTQTRRHTFIASLLGIRHVIVAVNKMDLVDWSEARFEQIRADYLEFARALDIDDLQFIPLSALAGDNVVDASTRMPWYRGSTLMYLLETVPVGSTRNHTDFRFPVQWVNRPNADYRGYSGTVASGSVRIGDDVLVLPSRRRSRIAGIDTFDGTLGQASTPMAVTLRLEDNVDIARGDMIVHAHNAPEVRDRFDATVVWMVDAPMIPGGQYLIKHANKQTVARIDALRYRVDIQTLAHESAPRLGLNEIGRCSFSLSRPIALDPYTMNPATGAFIVIDRLTNQTVGAGMIRAHEDADSMWESAPKSHRTAHASLISTADRAGRLGQKPATILLTGLNGVGKTSVANEVERLLFDDGRFAMMIDGQSMRLGVCRDLGFTRAERSENLRRGVEIARMMNDAGLIVIAAYVAPDAEPRALAEQTIGSDRFLAVHLDAPIEVCRERDARGQYEAADRGEIADFPGVSAPYERPQDPDLELDTTVLDVQQSAAAIVALLRERGFLLARDARIDP